MPDDLSAGDSQARRPSASAGAQDHGCPAPIRRASIRCVQDVAADLKPPAQHRGSRPVRLAVVAAGLAVAAAVASW